VTVLGSAYVEVRRLPVANLATDISPAAGQLPPANEWAQIGAAQALGAVRVVAMYVNGSNVQVAGGNSRWIVIEAATIDGFTGLSGINGAVAIYSTQIPSATTTIPGGRSFVLTGIEGGALTFASVTGTAPAGATHLVWLARKA
jgi:hypothetical protein